MTTLIETLTILSPDFSISKMEDFDVDFARQLADDKNIPKEERDKIRRYIKNKSQGNKHETTYKLGKNCKHEFLGRLCALKSDSLQCLGKDIRNALASEFYWDLDFINAQPTLLKQYASKNGWKCDALNTYVEQREEFLTDICETMSIDRWEAKEKVIAILFGCGSTAIEGMPSFFVDEFYPEMRLIMKNNFEANKSVLKWLEKQPNCVGKGLAYVLQTEERNCLLALDKALLRRGRSMDVYIHDGGLVRKKTGEVAFSPALLRELEVEVEKETGYVLRLAVKPMKTTFVKINTEDDYAETKTDFELTHFKLRNPPRYVCQQGSSFSYLTDADLTFNYRNKFLSSGETFVSRWITDPDIRTYTQFEFKPKMETTEGCFNLFQGFPLEPKKGDWSAVRELLWDLSGRNQDNFDYLLNWTAHLFQKPFEKPEVVVIFSSLLEGVGKDTYADHILRPMLGNDYYFTTTDHENEIFGRFTSHLQNKLLVKMEEMNYDVMNRNDDKLKGWVTTHSKSYEEKGINKSPQIQSFHRWMGSTNEACPVKLTKTFRRYFLVNPFQGNAGNTAHWERMYGEFKKPEVLQAFYEHLLSMNIENWNPRTKCETDALKEARQSQAPPHARYFQQYIQLNDEMTTYSISAYDLLRRINEVSKFPYSPFKLAKELMTFPHTKTRKNSGNVYDFVLADVRAYLEKANFWVDE